MGGLGFNGWDFVSQLVMFLIVWFVLQKYIFPIVLKTLDQRAALIQDGVDNARKAEQELKDAQVRVEAILEEARREAQRTLAQATQAAQHVRDEIEQQAQERSRDILTQAEKRIQQEVAQARTELGRQVADIAILAAGRVIGESMDNTTNRRLVNEFVAQSRELQC